VHNTKELGCGRVVARFPQIVTRLKGMMEAFLNALQCIDVAWVADDTVEQLPLPTQVGKSWVGGIDPNRPRIRVVLEAVLALATSPQGFSVSEFAAKAQEISRPAGLAYGKRQAAYDLKKLRGKDLIAKVDSSRRYRALPQGLRTMAALLVLREKVIRPLLAGVTCPKRGRKPKNWTLLDQHDETLRQDMCALFNDLRIAA